MQLFKFAAHQENSNAQTSLAFIYERGRGGLPKNIAGAKIVSLGCRTRKVVTPRSGGRQISHKAAELYTGSHFNKWTYAYCIDEEFFRGPGMASPLDTPQTGPGQLQPVSAREILADHYFQKDLKGQQEWYGKRASKYNRSSKTVALTIIIAGAAISVVQIFNMSWVPLLTAVLGALVAIAESWRRIADYDKIWIGFRTASERMKRERRLFVNDAGPYRNLSDEEAFIKFVEAIEDVIADEQKLYWQYRSKQEQDSKKPDQSADGLSTSINR